MAVSIDTMKPAVARSALEAGASIINNVAAYRNDGKMWEIVSEFRAGYVVMHTPRGLHKKSDGAIDIVREVGRFFRKKIEEIRKLPVS